jgi:hypothetical protein
VSAVSFGRHQLATRAEADGSHTSLEAENVRGHVDKFVLNPLCSQLWASVCSLGSRFYAGCSWESRDRSESPYSQGPGIGGANASPCLGNGQQANSPFVPNCPTVPADGATLRHHVVRYSGPGRRGHSISYAVTSSVDGGSVAYGEEGPQTGDPLQLVLATFAEVDSGTHDEILDHSRDVDLTRCRECPDASRDMDR